MQGRNCLAHLCIGLRQPEHLVRIILLWFGLILVEVLCHSFLAPHRLNVCEAGCKRTSREWTFLQAESSRRLATSDAKQPHVQRAKSLAEPLRLLFSWVLNRHVAIERGTARQRLMTEKKSLTRAATNAINRNMLSALCITRGGCRITHVHSSL